MAGAVEYKFYPSTGGPATVVSELSLTRTDLNGLLPNHPYSAKVSALNNSGEGPLAARIPEPGCSARR